MARGPKTPAPEFTVESLAIGGDGISHTPSGQVIFIPETLPGDRIRLDGPPQRGKVLRARKYRLIEASPQRRTPPCPHHKRCGGCPWMILNYPDQLAHKTQLVRDAMVRLAQLPAELVEDAKGSEQDLAYRSRARFYVKGRDIGFHGRGSHRIIDTPECLVISEGILQLSQKIRRVLGPFLPMSDGLRIEINQVDADQFHLGITGTGAELLASLMTAPNLQIQTHSRAFNDKTPPLLAFQQANHGGNAFMMETVNRWINPQRGQSYVDIYCGGANFTVGLLEAGAKATGIEISEEAIGRAQKRCKGYKKAQFLQRTAEQGVRELLKKKRQFNGIVLNPPRGGAKEVAADLHRFGAEKIAYVSCNPATLARDLKVLSAHYKVETIKPVDLMPQTFHIESIALLSRLPSA